MRKCLGKSAEKRSNAMQLIDGWIDAMTYGHTLDFSRENGCEAWTSEIRDQRSEIRVNSRL
jgi:hypothetical protein